MEEKFVIKRNGKKELLQVDKINKVLERASIDLDGVSASEVALDGVKQLFNKIKTEEIDKALILTARSKIYREPNYSYLASRLLLNCIYKEVFKESRDEQVFEPQYRLSFIKNIKKLVKEGTLSKKCLDFDLKKLSEALVPDRDLLFKYSGIQNIYDRYLLRLNGKAFETPQGYYMRVAMGLCLNEEHKEEHAIEFYNTYSQHLASPSTPTLFNSATNHSQLSSCYLSHIHDSVDGIFDGLWQNARKSKYAGGLGLHVSDIRGTNAHIKGTNGTSSGLVPWLKIYNSMLIACDQAGKRAGAGCAYLENWHIDVEDFIDLRKESGEERRRTPDLNTAVWISDLFIERVEQDKEWTLLCPSEAPGLTTSFGSKFRELYESYEEKARKGEIKLFKVIKAKDLWKNMLKSLFETSHPWITYKDNWNMRYQNQHEGVLKGSQLCTEIGIYTQSSTYEDGVKTKIGKSGVCTLGSINLSRHLSNGKIDHPKLKSTISAMIRGLDNAISSNFYPTKEAEHSALDSRDIGMGTMGWSDLYYQLDIQQDSEEAVKLADELMEYISYCAIEASSELSKERGTYPNYEGSNWSKGIFPIDTYIELMKTKGKDENLIPIQDWKTLRDKVSKQGMRNAQVTAIAPNASIAYQLGVEQSIEPSYSVLYSYDNKSGKYYIINDYFVEDMKKLGLWNHQFSERVKAVDGDVSLLDIPQKYKDKYKTAFDRDQFLLIDANAARQKWLCQGASFNAYNKGSSLKFLSDYYIHGNKMGLKSHYYLRNVAASKAQKSTVETKQESVSIEEIQLRLREAREKAESGQSCEMCQG